MKSRSWFAVIALVAGVATLSVADTSKSGPDSSQCKAVNPMVDSINLAVDQWYDAILSGDDGQAHRCEKQLLKSLKADISRSQEQVHKLSSQLSSPETKSPVVDSSLNPLKDSLEQLKTLLTTKQMLVDAITRTDALSNKYRLLGDYVGLLRREVGLPKLKLAVDKKTEADKN
ncbi:MAG: hypothetical protein HY851_10750 [candidate division Zixibacteria bacterium]|nr:hypothetical protein [candidate division Zixibacteria bacterium]